MRCTFGRSRLIHAFAAVLFALASSAPAFAGEAVAARGLVDQRGVPVGLTDRAGALTLVTFVATRCTDACPISNAAFARLQTQARARRLSVRLLTVTLDPVFDTPFVMNRAAQQWDARAPAWSFASGDVATVHALMHRLGVIVTPDERGIPDMHSSFVYAFDKRGKLVKTFLLSADLMPEVAPLAPRQAGLTNPGLRDRAS